MSRSIGKSLFIAAFVVSTAVSLTWACSGKDEIGKVVSAAAPPQPPPKLPMASCTLKKYATPLPVGANNAVNGGNWKETTDGEDIWNPGGHYVQVNGNWQWAFAEGCSGNTLVETNPAAQIAGMANAPNHVHHFVGVGGAPDWQGNMLPAGTVYGDPWICDCFKACTDLGHMSGTCVAANYPGDALNAAVRASAKCQCNVPCGGIGQPCCELGNGPVCDTGVCDPATNMCVECGDIGQLCCADGMCDVGTCDGEVCFDCGEFENDPMGCQTATTATTALIMH